MRVIKQRRVMRSCSISVLYKVDRLVYQEHYPGMYSREHSVSLRAISYHLICQSVSQWGDAYKLFLLVHKSLE